MMKKLLIVICCAACCIAAAPGAFGAAYCDARLKGDADNDGRITSSDARAILRVCAELDPEPQEGTADWFAMKLTGSDVAGVTMEDVRIVKRLVAGLEASGEYYTKAELLSLFNTLADQVKSTDHVNDSRMTSFRSTRQKISVPSGETGAITGMFSSVILGSDSADETTCSGLSVDQPINYYFGYPVTGEFFVSMLRPEDVTSVVMENGKTAGLLSKYPDVIEGGDISAYKTVALEGLLKLTVNVKNESYTQLKKDGITEPALRRIHQKNIFDDFNDYNVTEEGQERGVTVRAELSCTEIATGATVEYWFQPGTLAPVAAKYTLRETVDMNTDFTLLYSGVTEKESSPVRLENTTEELYLFTPFITAAG